MQLHNLKPKNARTHSKRVGRGGKRGTTSGHGTKGQKGRAGAYVRPGFRGGDKRIWELFPKLRGASKKHGNSRPHRKHRFFKYSQDKAVPVALGALNAFADGTTITAKDLFEKGLIPAASQAAKILSGGVLKRKLSIQIPISKSAAEKVIKLGGTVAAQ